MLIDVYMFEIERTDKQTNKQKVQLCPIFYYISEPLNLSDFMMNLTDFNIL